MADTNNKRAFLAGASGAIGRRLCRLLVADGWQVTGTTRSAMIDTPASTSSLLTLFIRLTKPSTQSETSLCRTATRPPSAGCTR